MLDHHAQTAYRIQWYDFNPNLYDSLSQTFGTGTKNL